MVRALRAFARIIFFFISALVKIHSNDNEVYKSETYIISTSMENIVYLRSICHKSDLSIMAKVIFIKM